MRASWEYAGRDPGADYGNIERSLSPWRPVRSGGRRDDEAIYELSEQRYSESSANPDIPAAYPFFGQFVAHDITFDTRLDPRSALGPRHNRRTPALDLDSVYGRGPVDQPYLYELEDPNRFWIPRNVFGEIDLPRNNDRSVVHPSSDRPFNRRRSALIGDPRNDENTLISQLHLAFLRFHNARVDEGYDFEEARRITTWHYQWVVVHDFLPRLCGEDVLEKLANPSLMVLPNPPLLPNEFTIAAFRFGHSMLGSAYHLNSELQHRLGDAPIPLFDNLGVRWRDRDRAAGNSLEGERELPAIWTVQWDRFVDVGNDLAQHSRRIDSRIAPPLRSLPIPPLLAGDERRRSLAYLTLRRGYDCDLPSGQELADHLKLPVLARSDGHLDPLWIYVLEEADRAHRGRRLGPLGATLVGEVLIRLLRNDPTSFVRMDPGWTPVLAGRTPERFDLADFLRLAGVPITAHDWRFRLDR